MTPSEVAQRYAVLVPNLSEAEVVAIVRDFMSGKRNFDLQRADNAIVNLLLEQDSLKAGLAALAHGEGQRQPITEQAPQNHLTHVLSSAVNTLRTAVLGKGAAHSARVPTETQAAVPEATAPVAQPEVEAEAHYMEEATAPQQDDAEAEVMPSLEEVQPAEAPELEDITDAKALLDDVVSCPARLIVTSRPRVGKTSTINAMLTVPLLPVKYSGLSYTLEAASGLKYTLHATDAEGQDHTTSLELDHLPVFQQKQRMQEALESFADEVRFPGKAVHITGPLKLPKKLLLSERTGPVEVPEDTVVVVLVNDMPEEDILAYKQLNKGTVVFARITPGADKGEKGEGVPAGVDVVDIDPKHFLSVCLVAAFSPDQPGYQGTFDTFKAQVHTAIKLVQERGAQRRHEIAQTVQAAAAAMAQQWRDISHSAGSVMDTLSRPPASSERHVNVVPQDTTPATVPEVPAVPKNMEEPYVPASSSYQPPCTDYVPAASDYTPATSTWQPQPDC
eukprot:TRINITY_DN5753_c1_g1_i2.p1 TRINITY_DN5753_c1_g1~~TRINITY_DN5753_c1_g1_i2.p1  ORF type:complete len:528 (+),score=214.32 TRINITY_DN5753_c1_g1_i2:74-1585(+)